MKLYMKQKVFSWGDKFYIYDEQGNEVFGVEGEVFALGKKLHIYDMRDAEVAYVEQELFTFLPKYSIYCGERYVGTVVKEFTLFKSEYTVEELGWVVSGDFFYHDYTVNDGVRDVVTVEKELFTFGDAYEINISDNVDPVMALAVVLVIDACIES